MICCRCIRVSTALALATAGNWLVGGKAVGPSYYAIMRWLTPTSWASAEWVIPACLRKAASCRLPLILLLETQRNQQLAGFDCSLIM
jgi:hypothetical protein